MSLRNTLLAATVSLAGLAAPAQAEWYEVRTDQFIVYSEADREEAVEFAELLERYDRAMRVTQNIPFEAAPSDAQRVTVYHWGDGEDIARLATGSRAAGVRGFYIPRAGGPVAFSPIEGDSRRVAKGSRRQRDSRTALDRRSVLLHEYAHSFMLQHFPATYPSWYVEGFAEFYGQTDFLDDGSFHLGNPPQYRARFLQSAPRYPVRNLFDTSSRRDMMDVQADYAMGWLLIHYLTFSPDRQGQLGDYLARIQRGEQSLAAAQAAFGDLGELDSEVRRHLKGDLPGFNVKPPASDAVKVEVRPLSAQEEAVIEQQMTIAAGGTKERRESVARDLLRTVDPSTSSVMALENLGAAHYFLEDYAAAAATFARIIDLEPDNADAHAALGQIAMKRAETEEVDDYWEEARGHLLKAIQLDPHNPVPLRAYYESFIEAEDDPTETSILALEKAYNLAPYDVQTRLLLVRQLARENKPDLTAMILTPVAFAPHGNRDLETLQEAHAHFMAGENEEGRVMIEELFDKWEREEEEESIRH